ncbi:hypothetical protein BKA70DRAFT_1447882 [Coprinopsis sp. MPI-PUGE-AT-0042]|nr:hypothetical protein BKA70DRAFT_1447882 [Coprinopsis sp. MPI-PUGE-AT-0042]
MADDLWEFKMRDGKQDRSSRYLRREINSEDIISLKRRASRIRYLCVRVQASNQASIRSLAPIGAAATPNDGFLFPKLQELRIIGSAHLGDFTPLSVVLSPAITIFSSSALGSSSYMNSSFLASIARRCPNLTDAVFPINVAISPRAIHLGFRGLSCLRTLALTVDSAEAMATLSHLPSLQALTLTIHDSTNATKNTKTAALGRFSSLTSFHCASKTDLSPCRSAIAFLAKPTPLVSLTLSAMASSPLQTVIDIVELLAIHVDTLTLEGLFIFETPEEMQNLPVVDAATELLDDPFHLESLKDFCSLSSLRIDVMMPVSIGIQPLQTLAHLDLMTLVVGSFSDPAYGQCTPNIELEDLIQILDIFHSLVLLGLPIDASNVQLSNKRPGGGFVHGEELALLVGSSPIGRPQDVAEFLSDIVPNLESISPSQEMIHQDGGLAVDNPNFAKWCKAEEMVPFLVRIRGQERNTTPIELSESDEESDA